jgi:hypothetical protein
MHDLSKVWIPLGSLRQGGPRRRPVDNGADPSLRWKALTERLGPAGAMRFMMQYDPGYGDYSKERHTIFASVTLEQLLEAIKESNPESPES